MISKFSVLLNKALSRRTVWTKFFMIGLVLFFVSCKKESDIGLDVQPDSELIDLRTSDTMSMIAYTVREDSLRTDESPIVQIGSYVDPVFGKVSAGLFTQFSIPNSLTLIHLGAIGTFDSCAITLRYDYDFYGDTAGPEQIFNLYQVTEDMSKDSAYYSNHEKQYFNFPVGTTGSFKPRPRNPSYTLTDTLPAYLRIAVDPTFAQQVFNTSFADNAAFISYLKGFYIKPETPAQNTLEGALMRFNLLDSLTRLTFYYHTATDTTSFSFVVNSGSAYYSYFNHDYSVATGSINSQLASPGANSYSEVYVQACAGLKTKIEFPYLNDWKNLGYPIAINKAELVIKSDPGAATSNMPLNKALYVVYLDSVDNQYLLPDMFENASYYGGSLNTTTSEYHINIARYMQQLVDGEVENHGLYLKELSPVELGRRGILGSPNNATGYKMYLHLVYTRIN